jgi:sugar lactone lactonase YvrE
LIEQQLMSRPDMVDTDDDGLTDAEELARGTNPADPTDPAVSRSMLFSGDDFLTVPTSFRQRITDWTIEAWVYPTNASAAGQTVLRRTVQQIPGGEAMNYVLALEPLGAGTARVSAGYTLTDGTDVRIRGGEVPVNDWTHVAVAYNSLNASLSLYTNGGPAAVSNGLFRAPPINGKGGDTYVRIGENFQGNIDEVRLWNDPRDADEVRDDFLRYLDGDEVGLVHYIRFDDGEANENQIAFSEFHQPRGAQDFAYPEDWNDQWIHALLASGNPLFSTNGALTPPPSLRVVLLPQDAVNRGAQWSLNNGAWRDGGETIRNLDRFDLTHTIQYRSIPGYTAPTNETVTVSNGVTTVLTRTYLENGTLTVTVEPPEAIEAAFAIFKTRFLWNIGTFAQGEYEEREDQIWYLSGTTLTNVPIGGYTVRFAEIIGWNTPASIPVDVTEGLDAYVNGEYSAIEGQIQVTLEPRNAREEGARWRVDGGPWQESGTASGPLDYGEHTVEFLDLASWSEPGPQVIRIKENGVQNLSYTLQEVTGLYVQILPPAAEDAGARWGLVGGAITNRSGVLSLPEGAYAIRFTDLAGWISPEDANVAVTNGFMTRLTRYYYQVEELGAYGTNAPGALFHPRGMEFHSDRVLYIADTDNHRIQRYDALNGVWLTPWGGPGVGAGEFDQPVDVDLDAAGNLYVADLGNNRVQRRSPAGAWTVWGGTDPGTDPGEFWGPFGVAVDAADNLYVAEHYNRRIQRRTPAGAWSEILSNGVADSQVRRPRSLVAEAGGTLLITDFRETTPENALIRRVDSTGGLLATLLESPDGAGGIRKVGNLALEGGDALYAADMYGDVVRRLDFGTGEWSTLVDAGILDGPEGLAWDGLGNLYIADTGNHRVLKLLVAAGYVAQPAPLLAPLAGGGVSLGWPSQENVYYDIEYTEDLMNATGWQPLPGCQSLQATNGWIQCIDTNANFGQRFYRIQAY